MDNFEVTDRNKIQRSPHRGTYNRQAVYEILDAGFVCYTGFIDNAHPVIIPMSYGRKDDNIFLHGASTSRIMNLLAADNTVCINVTMLDGIVVARSLFDTSVNYRSVVIFGKAEKIDDTEKMEALQAISEHILPGRWEEVRAPLSNELKATVILKVKIENASAKIRTGPPDDDIRDLDSPVWAGVIPLKPTAGTPINDPAMKNNIPIPRSVASVVAKYLTILLITLVTTVAHAQLASFSLLNLTTLPNGSCKKASVTEQVGITDVTITYCRPAVRGRDGEIWGNLVHEGYTDFGFGTTTKAPWRAGANENTTIEFSMDVKIEGNALPAGKYGFFIAYGSEACTLIFSRNSTSWGSFYYSTSEDVLRVNVKPVATDQSVEWLRYEFLDQTENTAVVALEWEKLRIPFRVEVDYIKTQIESFRRELRGTLQWRWQAWAQAAQWCVQRNTNLEEALLWTDSATSINYGGDQSFLAWSTRAQVLDKLGRETESAALLKKALPYGSMLELSQYARQLIAQKKIDEAFGIFKSNYDRHPKEFISILGMARAFSARGEYKKALEFAQRALAMAGPFNQQNVKTMIDLLQQSKDIN